MQPGQRPPAGPRSSFRSRSKQDSHSHAFRRPGIPSSNSGRARRRSLAVPFRPVRADFDFHPDENTVRVFTTPDSGVLRLDDDVAVTEALYEGVVLRHYAFADQWFKVNVTTDLGGGVVETGPPGQRFAFNCDVATPMERDGDETFAVDLFLDVLVRADLATLEAVDHDEFKNGHARGMLSDTESFFAMRALHQLVHLVETGRLLPWLHDVYPFGPCQPPEAPPMRRALVPDRLLPGVRRSW